METKKSPVARIVKAALFLGCVFFVAFFVFFVLKKTITVVFGPDKVEEAPLPEEEESDSLLPARLKIPSLKINAPVEHVGLTPDGAVGVPKGAQDAAWYNLSARPGAPGSAVIDGHSGYKNDKPAIFDNLHLLKKGDKIYVEDAEGASVTFVVREMKSYGNKEEVSRIFSSDDKKSHLNLITCAGDWNALEKTHSKRLVVFTDKEM